MKRYPLTLFFFLIHLHSFGQYNSGSNRLFQEYQLQIKAFDNRNIEGTPYITDYWNQGKIVAKSGITFENVKIRYDAMNDELHTNKGGQSMVVPKTIVGSFYYTDSLSGDKISFIYSKKHSRFVQSISDQAHATVFRSYKKKLIKANKPSDSYGVEKRPKDRLKNKYEFIIEFMDKSSTVNTEGSASDFYKAFPSSKKAIKDYIKTKKLRLKDEADLVDLSGYIGTIIN